MEEEPTTSQDKEPICSEESLQKFYEKHPRILFIALKDDMKEFAKKFANEAAPDGVTIVEVQAGGSCEAIEKLALKDASTAILVEKGEVRDRITLQNDDVKDTVALMKALSDKPSKGKTCETELIVDGKGWKIKLEPSSPCERELSNLSKLPPSVQKYLTKHLET